MMAISRVFWMWLLFLWGGNCCETPLTADTLQDFRSVLQLDFNSVAETTGKIKSGWLRVRHDGQQVVLLTQDNDLVIWDIVQNEWVASYQVEGEDGLPANMMDAFWTPTGRMLISLHHDGATYTLARFEVGTGALAIQPLDTQQGIPVRVWGDDEWAWLEWMPHDSTQVPFITAFKVDGQVVQPFPSVAEQDRDSSVRIGRMPAPLAVTANEQGVVRLWHLEQGSLLHEDTLNQMPVLGTSTVRTGAS